MSDEDSSDFPVQTQDEGHKNVMNHDAGESNPVPMGLCALN